MAVTFLFTDMAGDTPSHTCNMNNLYQRINQKHFAALLLVAEFTIFFVLSLTASYIHMRDTQLHILGELAPFHSFLYLEGKASHPSTWFKQPSRIRDCDYKYFGHLIDIVLVCLLTCCYGSQIIMPIGNTLHVTLCVCMCVAKP